MTEPNPNPNPNPTPSGGEPSATPAPPDPEARIKELETQAAEAEEKRQEAVREMNERMRRAAELETRLAAQEGALATYQAQLAQFQQKTDPTVQLQQEIAEAQKAGEYERAGNLSLQLNNQLQAQALQATATIGLMNSVNQALVNPNLSKEAKQILKEEIFRGGDPKQGIRQEKLGELLSLSVKPGAFEELLQISEERAKGRKVITGEYDKEYETKRTEAERQRQEELKRQTSITQPGGGIPSPPLPQEKVKELEKKVIDEIIGAKFAPI